GCSACGRSRPLSGALGSGAVASLLAGCSGRRPWLDAHRQNCGGRPEALQRGASNVYFSVTRSALSIPPWTDPLQSAVAAFWTGFTTPLPAEAVDPVLASRFPGEDPTRLRECLARFERLQAEPLSVRAAEYDVLSATTDHNEETFQTLRQPVGQ